MNNVLNIFWFLSYNPISELLEGKPMAEKILLTALTLIMLSLLLSI